MKLRVEPATWVLLGVAGAAVAWAHVDAGQATGPTATLVSSRSAAWRVLPELAGTDARGATVELEAAHGQSVRLVPDGAGHQVWVDDQVLGPADPEAMAGVWDSLRMATTVRAADEAAESGLGEGGRIVVTPPQAEPRVIVLGRPTADGAGRYGVIEGGAQGTAGLWVLEQELHVLLEQSPQAWLARRAVVAEPADIIVVRQGDLVVERGIDDLWRARVGSGEPALLDRMAVQTRLDRLLSARLDPLVEPQPDSDGTPWITLEGASGADWALRRHGGCPDRPTRVLVSRGPGRWGCVDGAVAEPWPVPGRGGPQAGVLLDPHLVPYDYGRVLRVEQSTPSSRVLRRHGGAWRIEQSVDGRTAVFDVDEPEVFRWFEQLRTAEVSLAESTTWPATPDAALTLSTDSTATMALRCVVGPPMRCRRNDGPVLRVRGAVPVVDFDVDTFAQRRLVALPSEDVRAVEILPGTDDGAVVRQSAHFDLGVWRLDAPVHPEGDAALDEGRLSGLLGTLGSLRAARWLDAPVGDPLRTLRVERVPRRGEDPVLVVTLHEECVVQVPGHRPAVVSEGTCASLAQDLLVNHPLQRAIETARSLELTTGGDTVRLQRSGETWVAEDGSPATAATAWLSAMTEQTAERLRQGTPGAVTWTLRVLPTRGTAFDFEGGAGWAGVQGQSWSWVFEQGVASADG